MEAIVHPIINTAISQSSEKLVEGLIKTTLALASSNLIPQVTLNEAVNQMSQIYGKELVTKILVQSAAEELSRILPQATGSAIKGISSSVVTKGIQVGIEKGSFLDKSLQTFIQNSGKTTLLNLATIPAELGVEYLLKQMGADRNLTQGVGFLAGLSMSIGIGCIAGPIGAAVNGGTYLIGKGLGSLVKYFFFRDNSNIVRNQEYIMDERSQRRICDLIAQEYFRYPQMFREKYLDYYVKKIHKKIQTKYLNKPFNVFLMEDLIMDLIMDMVNELCEINLVNIIETIGILYPNSNYVEALRKLNDQLNSIGDFIKKNELIFKLFKKISIKLLNGENVSDDDKRKLADSLSEKLMEEAKKVLLRNVIDFVDKFFEDLSRSIKNYKLKWEIDNLIKLLTFLIANKLVATVNEMKELFADDE